MTEKDRFTLTICSIIIIAATLTEIMIYFNEGRNYIDFFSGVVGFIGYFVFFFRSQQILNKNQFKNFGLSGLSIFLVCLTKQVLLGFHLFPLFLAALPFLYVIYFRIITSIFYKDYPNIIPTIVYSSKSGSSSYQGDDQGYIPTMKERFFSLLLFLGFLGTSFVLIIVISRLTQGLFNTP